MPISAYIHSLRHLIGSRLLLLPAGVAIIRNHQGQILLVCNADSGQWSLPAGGVEPTESPEAAVIREVAEETGLTVIKSQLVAALGGKQFRTTYSNGDEVEYTVCVFECEVDDYGTLAALDEEISMFQWVHPEQVAGRLCLPYPPELFVHKG